MADLFCKVHGVGEDEQEIDLAESEPAKRLNLAPESSAELHSRFINTYEQLKGEFL
jgi:hypothetical protein